MLGRRESDGPLATLTPREREVLAAMAEGKSNKGIAEELFVTEAAVEKHVTSIFQKLGLSPSPDRPPPRARRADLPAQLPGSLTVRPAGRVSGPPPPGSITAVVRVYAAVVVALRAVDPPRVDRRRGVGDRVPAGARPRRAARRSTTSWPRAAARPASSSTPRSASASRCSPTPSWSRATRTGCRPGRRSATPAPRSRCASAARPTSPSCARSLPISDAAGAPLQPGARADTVVDYLFLPDSANLVERRETADRYAAKYLGGERAGVVGTTGAAPARLAQYEEIQDALPFVEAASVGLILVVVGLAFRSLGAPLVTLFTAAIAYLIAIRVLPYVGRARRRDRAERGRADHRRAAPRAGDGLLGVLPVGDAPASTPRAAARAGGSRRDPPDRADRVHRRVDRRRRHRCAGGRRARLLPGVRPGAGDHHADRARWSRSRWCPRCWGCSARGCSAATSRATGPQRRGPSRSRTATPDAIERARRSAHAEEPGRSTSPSRWAHFRLALTRPATAVRRVRRLRGPGPDEHLATAGRPHRLRPVRGPADRDRLHRRCSRSSRGTRATPRSASSSSARSRPTTRRGRPPPPRARASRPASSRPPRSTSSSPASRRGAQLARLRGPDRPRAGRRRGHRPARAAAAAGPADHRAGDGGAARLAVVLDVDPLGAPAIDRYEALRAELPDLLRQSRPRRPAHAIGGETALAAETVQRMLDDLQAVGVVVARGQRAPAGALPARADRAAVPAGRQRARPGRRASGSPRSSSRTCWATTT